MLTTIILAGGQGKRMKSDLPKVLNKLGGRALIDWVKEVADKIGSDQIILVVGYKKELVISHVGDSVDYAVQEKQLGTAHAVSCAEKLIRDGQDTVLVLNGDMPLLNANDIENLIDLHKNESSTATLLTAEMPNPFGYGRIVRNNNGLVGKIVEEKDASEREKQIKEVCTGTYCFNREALTRFLKEVGNDNAQKEYYLTDLIEILNNAGKKVIAYKAKSWKSAVGTNTVEELELAEKLLDES